MKQRDLYDLLPGYPGGRALRDAREPGYHQRLGATGGARTVARYGTSYMASLGERGRAARLIKRYTQVRTEHQWDGTIYRVIPYRPAQSRRRWPDLVKIDLEEEESQACLTP